MSDNTFEILSEEPVTANAKPAEKMPRIVNTNPGQSGSAEDLGGPLIKPSPDTEPTPGKAASAKAKKLSNRITQGAGAADAMPTLQGSAPGQKGMKEEEEIDEDEILAEQEEFNTWVNSLEEEGYDLSEHTWDDLIDIYLDEAEGSYGATPKAYSAARQTKMTAKRKPFLKKMLSRTNPANRTDPYGSPRKGLTADDRERARAGSSHGVGTRQDHDYPSQGPGGVTKSAKKLRKQKAIGEDLTVDVKEDVSALLNGEDLTEDFKFKAATIFEAAVKAKVIEELEKYEQIYQDRLNEEIEEIKESLETRVEAHLDYVSDQWLVENQLAVDNGLRSELSEEFILGIKNVFESCYVDIPEDKYDILGEMSERLDQMEEKLNEQIEVNVELNSAIGEFIKDGIIAEVSEGLAQTQKEKLASLAEGVEFISEESYREKIEMIKESYFHKSPSSYAEDLVEQTQTINVEGPMAAYAAALSKWSK